MPALISLLVSLVILGLVLWLLYWVISLIPAPEPVAVAIRVVFGLICVIALLSLLFGGWAFPFAAHPLLR